MNAVFSIRAARLDDAPSLELLMRESVLALQARDYSREQMEGALGTVFGVDSQLIHDGTYFVVEREGCMVGCGGWSRRKTLFGGDAVEARTDDALMPGSDAARIRAFFIAPNHARQGIGSLLMQHCEQAAAAFGFHRLELVATLTGEKLYLRHGFTSVERYDVPLRNGSSLPVVKMLKVLAG